MYKEFYTNMPFSFLLRQFEDGLEIGTVAKVMKRHREMCHFSKRATANSAKY